MFDNLPHIDFIREIDKLKTIFRQSLLLDRSRRESVAEHSWHLAMAVMMLESYSNFEKINMFKAVKMALVHDIVEIDAGDTFAYDPVANKDKKAREEKAATRIYGLLPQVENDEMIGLWHEFEAAVTPEAKFVDAVDRFIPIMHNFLTDGIQWRAHKVTPHMVLTRNAPIKGGSLRLWSLVEKMVREAVEKGYLQERY